jgi:hypothetical protein
MRVEILRSVMISGEPALAGSFVEVSLSDAQLLINLGKARKAEAAVAEVKAEPKAAPAPEPKAEVEAKPKRTRSTTPKE